MTSARRFAGGAGWMAAGGWVEQAINLAVFILLGFTRAAGHTGDTGHPAAFEHADHHFFLLVAGFFACGVLGHVQA